MQHQNSLALAAHAVPCKCFFLNPLCCRCVVCVRCPAVRAQPSYQPSCMQCSVFVTHHLLDRLLFFFWPLFDVGSCDLILIYTIFTFSASFTIFFSLLCRLLPLLLFHLPAVPGPSPPPPKRRPPSAKQAGQHPLQHPLPLQAWPSTAKSGHRPSDARIPPSASSPTASPTRATTHGSTITAAVTFVARVSPPSQTRLFFLFSASPLLLPPLP